MSEFYIFYWGLICHIGDPENPAVKTHASLARAPRHVRQIIFSDREPIPLGTNVEFPGGAGTATRTDEFADGVPSLRALLGSFQDAKPGVRNRAENPNVALHVSYPADATVTLGIANLYPQLGRYRRGSVVKLPRLIARIVYAKVETTADTLTLQFNGTSRSLTETDPCVLIANAENRPDDDNDFRHHGVLLVGDPDAGEMTDVGEHGFQVAFPSDCEWVLDYVENAGRAERLEAALSTECGNTQWP